MDLQPAVFTSEALARAFANEEVKGLRFCLPQGALADPSLGRELAARGAVVEPWMLYETEPETEDVDGRAGTLSARRRALDHLYQRQHGGELARNYS